VPSSLLFSTISSSSENSFKVEYDKLAALLSSLVSEVFSAPTILCGNVW